MATNELTSIDYQIAATTNSSVAASRRIVGIAAETEQLGVKTVTTLIEQGEQLENIGDSVREIGVDVRYAKYQASKLEFCGCCYRCCHSSKLPAVEEKRVTKYNQAVVNTQPRAVRYDSDQPMIRYVLDDDREVEIDQNLRETGRILNNLDELARDIGRELDHQNELIPTLTVQSEKTSAQIQQVTDQLRENL